MADRDREALRRAKANARDAAAERQRQEQLAVDEHAVDTAAAFAEARHLARDLEARGFPGIQVVPHWTPGGWFRSGRRLEMGGWMVYDLGDGGDRWESTKVYLISDGRLQIAGGEPLSDADHLLTPHRAAALLAALRRMKDA